MQVPSYTIISDSSYHSFLSLRACAIFKQRPLFIMFYWMSSVCPSSSTLHPKPLCSIPWGSTCTDLSSWEDHPTLANCLDPGSPFLCAGPPLVPCLHRRPIAYCLFFCSVMEAPQEQAVCCLFIGLMHPEQCLMHINVQQIVAECLMITDSGLRKIFSPLTFFLFFPLLIPHVLIIYSIVFITLLISSIILNNMIRALFLIL